MFELAVYNMNGEKVDALELDEVLFGGAVNRNALREAVLMYQAARRSGTAAAKNRVQVRATGAKPFRQKGTGRARQGTTVAPHHRGGGVAHGPRPRSYRYPLSKRVRRAALKSAFLDVLPNAARVIDHIRLDAPKTRLVADLLRRLGIDGSCLIATCGTDPALVRSARNLPGVTVKRIRDVNALDLLRPRYLLVTRRALESTVERFRQDADAEGAVT
jgi:large subunit ribosomal protein L4